MFHATTGYSWPTRCAPRMPSPDRRIWTGPAMFELLARAFEAALADSELSGVCSTNALSGCEPDRRWVVMQRFYGLNQPLIERFYAGRSTWLDKVRILTGKPPVAILRALKCLPQSSAAAHNRGTKLMTPQRP